MSTKKKATKRGKRYTAAEKQAVVDFVTQMNSEKGRGGQSAASKKFGITALTISSWLKSSGNAPKKRGRKPKGAAKAAPASTGGSIDKKLAQLQSLYKEIARTEASLATLKKQFQSLKSSL